MGAEQADNPGAGTVVRPSKWFSALFLVVGVAMIVERFVTGDGPLFVGVLMLAAGFCYFLNRVVVRDDGVRIETPLRRVDIASVEVDRRHRQHVRDGVTGEVHRLPIGMWIEDIEPALQRNRLSESR